MSNYKQLKQSIINAASKQITCISLLFIPDLAATISAIIAHEARKELLSVDRNTNDLLYKWIASGKIVEVNDPTQSIFDGHLVDRGESIKSKKYRILFGGKTSNPFIRIGNGADHWTNNYPALLIHLAKSAVIISFTDKNMKIVISHKYRERFEKIYY